MTQNALKLPCPKSGAELLDMYYLEIRCNLLEAAATFDRLERSPDASFRLSISGLALKPLLSAGWIGRVAASIRLQRQHAELLQI